MNESVPNRSWTRPIRFLREVRQELHKVTWPTGKEVIIYTGVVVMTVVILGLFVFVLDQLFSRFSLMLFGS